MGVIFHHSPPNPLNPLALHIDPPRRHPKIAENHNTPSAPAIGWHDWR
jgi:hypothetical protein